MIGTISSKALGIGLAGVLAVAGVAAASTGAFENPEDPELITETTLVEEETVVDESTTTTVV
ncbi:MAG: hypothetical protein OEW42_17980, partial [Acidimicrobiia bacterium]|nr:hypothetical protein [Acidimicrobiia bacterium]